jgi:hypothetical protein
MAHPPCFSHFPCSFPFAPLVPFFDPLSLTWNPPSCDRIRPPRSQVDCNLTSPFSPLPLNPPPSNFPEPQMPSAPLRRPQDDSGVFCPEHLLLTNFKVHLKFKMEPYSFLTTIRSSSHSAHLLTDCTHFCS